MRNYLLTFVLLFLSAICHGQCPKDTDSTMLIPIFPGSMIEDGSPAPSFAGMCDYRGLSYDSGDIYSDPTPVLLVNVSGSNADARTNLSAMDDLVLSGMVRVFAFYVMDSNPDSVGCSGDQLNYRCPYAPAIICNDPNFSVCQARTYGERRMLTEMLVMGAFDTTSHLFTAIPDNSINEMLFKLSGWPHGAILVINGVVCHTWTNLIPNEVAFYANACVTSIAEPIESPWEVFGEWGPFIFERRQNEVRKVLITQ